LVVSVIGIVIGIVVADSSIKKLLSLSSAMSAVDCVHGCSSLAVEAMAGGSHLSMFAVLLVVSVIVVVSCIVSIVVVIGSIFQKVFWSCIKLAWMLAFSALKSMHCGGGVMGR